MAKDFASVETVSQSGGKSGKKSLLATVVDPGSELTDREEVLSSLNESLREEYQNLVRMFAGQLKKSVFFYHDVGGVVRKIYNDVTTYGANAVEKIAFLLGVEKTLLYRMMQFHTSFSRQELEEIIQRSESYGSCALSWSHFVLLLSIRDKDRRLKILDEAIARNMTVEELRSILRLSRGARSDKTLEPSASGPSVVAKTANKSKNVQAPLLPSEEVLTVSSIKENLDYFLDYLSQIYEDLKRTWTDRCLLPLQRKNFLKEHDSESLSGVAISIQDVVEVANWISQFLKDMVGKFEAVEGKIMNQISEEGAVLIEKTEEEHALEKARRTEKIRRSVQKYSEELGLVKTGRIAPNDDDPDDSGSFEDEEASGSADDED
ncbi:MAG: hypothetical protein QW299_09020 [Candidatus Caldarchaeum sp.]